MRKKIFTVILISFLFGLVACVPLVTPTPATFVPTSVVLKPIITSDIATPILAQTPLPVANNLSRYVKQVFQVNSLTFNDASYLEELSPDWQWSIHRTGTQDTWSLELISTTQPSVTLHSTFDPLFRYPGFVSWSPDSSAFVAAGAPGPIPKCNYDRIAIFSIAKDDKSLERHVLKPYSTGKTYCVNLDWSPDSQRLAVSINQREIFIVDRNARILQEISPKLNDNQVLVEVRWLPDGLLYAVETDWICCGASGERRWIDLQQPSIEKVVFPENSTRLILSLASDPSRALISDYQTNELAIFDMKTGLSKTISSKEQKFWYRSDLKGDFWDGRFIALANNDYPAHLFIFDWENGSIKDYGVINRLIGWRSDLSAFAVILGEPTAQQSIGIIRPITNP